MAKSAKRDVRPIREGAEALSGLSTETVDALKQLAKEVRDETLELVQAGRERVEELGGATGGIIRSNPFRSVCIALGIGCLIGFVLGRRCD